MQEKLLFSMVVFHFLFFFQSKIANSFYSIKKDSSGVRTTWFWSGRFRDRVPIVPSIFYDFELWHPLPPPLLCIKFLDTRKFLKHRRVPLRNSSVLWYKKFSTENHDIPFLCIKFFDTPNFLKHWRVPQETFWYCEIKKTSPGNRDTPPPL